MNNHLFCKIDLSRFLDCPRKALYGRNGYESKRDRDPFLAFLGEDARAVKRAAGRLVAGGGCEGWGSGGEGWERTRKLLENSGDLTLREPTVHAEGFVARPSFILRREGKFYLINVSAKAGDRTAHRAGRMLVTFYGKLRSEWREHVLGLAFDSEVLRRTLPGAEIIPYLLLPCGDLPTGTDEAEIADVDLELTYDASSPELVATRRKESVLRFFEASDAVALARAEVASAMDVLTRISASGAMPEAKLRYACRNCEYRLGKSGDGFSRCWGSLADPRPHLFDLHQLYSLKDGKGLLADRKIEEMRTSLFDVSEKELHGEHRDRQAMQLKCARSGEEWVDPRLALEIARLQWPVRFIDFETSQAALPWLEGVRPYELLPFQWSLHTLLENGRLEHEEWLHDGRGIPTAKFIATLRAAVGESGSVLIYTPYEIQVLDLAKARLFEERGYEDPDVQWIEQLLTSRRLVDQHEWTMLHYCHPLMGDKSSLKKALPAVWRESDAMGSDGRFSEYEQRDENGRLLDPYATLPAAIVGGEEIEIREGCGAMKGYRALATGADRLDSREVIELRRAMLAYCRLDTAAQVILFEWWRARLGLSNPMET